jgi:hypothetical protein
LKTANRRARFRRGGCAEDSTNSCFRSTFLEGKRRIDIQLTATRCAKSAKRRAKKKKKKKKKESERGAHIFTDIERSSGAFSRTFQIERPLMPPRFRQIIRSRLTLKLQNKRPLNLARFDWQQ